MTAKNCTCSSEWKRRNKDTHAPYCASKLEQPAPRPAVSVKRLFGALDETLAVLPEVRAGLLEALHRAALDSDGGVQAQRYQGGRGPSTDSDDGGKPVIFRDHQVAELVAVRSSPGQGKKPYDGDPVAREAQTVVVEVNRALEAAQRARAAVNRLRALDPSKARALADEIAGTVRACANSNCGHLAAGTRNDRLKSGRCLRCYEYRLRTGNERPKELCEDREVQPMQPIAEPA